jgi:hypothetical protein
MGRVRDLNGFCCLQVLDWHFHSLFLSCFVFQVYNNLLFSGFFICQLIINLIKGNANVFSIVM